MSKESKRLIRLGANLSGFYEDVYLQHENLLGPNLDYVRNSFGRLFSQFHNPKSKIETDHIGNSHLFYTGFDYEFLNLATIHDHDQQIVEAIVRKIARWNVKNSITLAGAGLTHANFLKERGYIPSHSTPFMVHKVDNRFDGFELREGLVAKKTESIDEIELNIKMISETFSMAEEWVRILFETSYGYPATFRYLLYDCGVPVSTCLFITKGEFVGCFDVVTPVVHQRKGYGAELMKYMLKEQASIGSKLIALQSSQAGKKLYSALGFQVLEYQQQWKMTDPSHFVPIMEIT